MNIIRALTKERSFDLERVLTTEIPFNKGLCRILGHKFSANGYPKQGMYTLVEEMGNVKVYEVEVLCPRCKEYFAPVYFESGRKFGTDDRTREERDELIDLSLNIVREVGFDNTFDVGDLRNKLDRFVANYGLVIRDGRVEE